MRRASRWTVSGPALVLTMAVVLVVTGAAAEAMVLKLASIAPEGTALTNALRAAGEEIQQKTEGRVSLKVYPGGVMGNDAVVLRKVKQGQLHGGTFTAGGIAAVDGNYQVLGMPMLLTNYAQVDQARAKFEPALTQGLEKKGFVSFGMLEAGFIYLMSSKPVAKPADLKDHKVWVPEGDPISRAVFEQAEVHPIPLPLPDVLTGLQTNLIDTVSTSPVAAIVLQWFTKVGYLTEVPLLYSYGTLALAGDAWAKLNAKDQGLVREVLQREVVKVNQQTRKDNEAALQTLRKQGIRFVPLSGEDLSELERIADNALASFRGKGVFDYSLLEAVRKSVAGL